MKQFLARLGRRVWSWRTLKIVLWLVTLVTLFYAEENWRGARLWTATKAKWEARGEVLDYAKFQPPEVPESQNLGALPLFQSSPAKDWRGHPVRDWLILERTLGGKRQDNDFPSAGNWMRGDLPDMKKIAAHIAKEYAAEKKIPPVSPDPLVQFESLHPFIDDLRRESAARPLCRFDTDDGADFPVERSYHLMESVMLLSKYLVVDSLLQLKQGHSDLALADLRVIVSLRSGVALDPTLVSAGFAVALTSIMNGAVRAGLLLHAWNDTQLAELQQIESSLDFLALFHFDMRATAAESIVDTPLMESGGRQWYMDGVKDAGGTSPWWFLGNPRTVYLWPEGWFQIDLANTVDVVLERLPVADLTSRQIKLKVGKQLREAMGGPDAVRPWNIRSRVLYDGDYVCSFAFAQAWSDEARLACALERYRLLHRAYPSTLDALAPEQIGSIPHDVMSGQSFHYRVRPDGSYLLYSVGWLQKDEGGRIALRTDGTMDLQNTNWTWPSPKP